MSEESKNIRLNKAAKEFNVGLTTLVEFLQKKGHPVESNPNARITMEQYDLLAQEFQKERLVKENAARIELNLNGKDHVTIKAQDVAKESWQQKDEGEELTIKNYHRAVPSKPKEEEPAVAEPVEKAEVAETDAPTLPEAEQAVEEPTQPTFEPQVIRTSVPGVKEGKESYNAEVKIVDKIDLGAINDKVRPKKKTREERAEEEKAKRAAAKSKKAAEPATRPAPTPVVEPTPKPAKPVPEPRAVEFIETQYTTLEGPTVVDTIVLSQFERDKAKP